MDVETMYQIIGFLYAENSVLRGKIMALENQLKQLGEEKKDVRTRNEVQSKDV